MRKCKDNALRFTRRQVLQQLASAPLLLRTAPLFGFSHSADESQAATSAALPLIADRYQPSYPARSPLEDVLRMVTPGLDDFPAEKNAWEIGLVTEAWCRALEREDFASIGPTVAPIVQLGSLRARHETTQRSGFGIVSVHREFATATPGTGVPTLLQALRGWIGDRTRVEHATIELTALQTVAGLTRATLRLNLVLIAGNTREQRVAKWQTEWQTDSAGLWLLTLLQPVEEASSKLHGSGFVDVTSHALGGVPSYTAQLRHGSDFWRTTLDGACGIDVYGNNGVAAGDYDNDGFDDLYLSQPAGLPNRLYRNLGDGTFEDVTDRAGVGVLDNTACALFADFRNIGLQDLLVVCGSGPLLFQNNGNGTFTLKRDAFHFAQPPQGTFTHAAIADYDRDGKLDVYFCLYSYYLGLDQYHYPTPYFDARNGPPNFLMHNQGDGTFVDRTEAAGLRAENDRYSFACAWGETIGNKMPDLYVVNDFGRNNLYRGKGDGTFRAVSEAAHVQDVGAGMSACWADIDNDGKPDLYVANMWSAAGQRVSHEAKFHAASSNATRELYRRHARGNALYRNKGDGTFQNVSDAAGVEVGRWAWGSDAWDFDHDGLQDLYVTNGYITAPEAPAPQIDLGSFFWRQVVAKSPDDSTPSLAYEHGWNALNELIRTDSSWSGNERNVLFANNGDGTFSDVSGAVGLDFLEDGRAFALADLDGDGRLEVIVKNRSAPQVRVLRNAMDDLGDALVLRLRGTTSNRDAIGTVIELRVGDLLQTKSLAAGTGFLAQHSKELFFGLGNGTATAQATVHWPSGLVQRFHDLPRNHRMDLVEGNEAFQQRPFAATSKAYLTPDQPIGAGDVIPKSIGTWLIDPLPAPAFTLPALSGPAVSLDAVRGDKAVLLFFTTSSTAQLTALEREKAALQAQRVRVLAINVDEPGRAAEARATAQSLHVSFPLLFATAEVAGVYNLVFRYLFDRRANLPLPTTFLLDAAGNIVKVYQGAVTAMDLAGDAATIPTTDAARARRALPFPGTLYLSAFGRNDFTYGVAMFQHGYLDQAAASFEQVIATRPNDAEAHYNLGTLSLRRGDFAKAKQYLQRTLDLKPNYPEAWNNLGMMAAQQGQTADAVHSFQQSLQQRPAYATALLNLGNLFRHERDFQQAQVYLLQALKLQPDDPEANYSVGMFYAQQNQLPAAQQYLQRAIDLRPDYPEALNNLGVLFVRQQLDNSAEKLFQTCVQLSPNFEGSYLNLARLYFSRDDRAKARASLLQLLALHPESATGKQALQALDAAP